ncbi:MAG: hypothetical protein GKS07_08325 [Nitrosopumilus sp.]|nr:MAG: hypothetical protein GKS07_08325 [Nitrosopumilus sp.]
MKLVTSIAVLAVVTVLVGSAGSVNAETDEEIVYFDMNENPEAVKQKVSDAFWENPINTPPMLVLLAIIPVLIFIAWKRKWHVHQKASDMRKGEWS